MAQDGPPNALAQTDPSLHAAWTRAVEAYRERGWGNMTPARVDAVIARRKLRVAERVAAHLPPPGTMTARPECFPDSVIERVQALADAYPRAEVVLVGGQAWNIQRDPGESDEDFEARAALFRAD